MAIYCQNCGRAWGNDARFCSACGSQISWAQPAAYATSVTRLIRPRHGRMIAGVCQGLANSYAWDVTWVRAITVLLAIFGGGSGLLAYLIFWVVMPEEPLLLPPVNPYQPPS